MKRMKSKRKKEKWVPIDPRAKELMAICRHLGLYGTMAMKNGTILQTLATPRGIPLGHNGEQNLDAVLEWFRKNENISAQQALLVPHENPAKPVASRKPSTKPSKRCNHNNGRPAAETKDAFYDSWEWRTLRMEVIKEYGKQCQCCGSQPGEVTVAGKPVRIVVDHIKSISRHWHLRLVKSNLQILCDECNMGKGAWDETDHRPPAANDDETDDESGVNPLIIEQLRYVI